MKLVFKLSLFLLTLFAFDQKLFSLTDYKIRKICKKEKSESICIKILKEKRSQLQKGNKIEIPVIPHQKQLNFKF